MTGASKPEPGRGNARPGESSGRFSRSSDGSMAGSSGKHPRVDPAGTSSGRLRRPDLDAALGRASESNAGATRQAGAARETKGETKGDGEAGGSDPQRLVGKTLGPCKILKLIGEGGLGRVYRARHLRLEQDVAVKVVGGVRTPKPEALARFRREATIAAKLNHPHIARVLDTNEQDGIHYIIQELVAGTSLEERLREDGGLPAAEVVTIGLGLASGLGSIHKAGVVHRDLKPANVMIAADGQPKLLDFGIAKDLEGDASFTDDKAMLGTPTFLAPEQVSGSEKVGPPADVYGLGGTLFYALTGRAPHEPFEDDTLLRFLNRRTKEPAPDVRTLRKDVPAPLASLLAKLLAIDPADRPTAEEVVDVLRTIERTLPPPARTGPPPGLTKGIKESSSGRLQALDAGPRKGSSDRLEAQRGSSDRLEARKATGERATPPSERHRKPGGAAASDRLTTGLKATPQPPTPPPQRTGGIQGSLEDMSLVEILQGVEFNAKTGQVEVEGQGVSGVIEFQEGNPWDATTTDGESGEPAIRKLLAVSSGSFALRSCDARDGTRRVKVSFTRLLLDQSRVTDESSSSGRFEAIEPAPPAADDEPDTSEIPLTPKKAHSTDELRSAVAALEAMALPDPVGDPFLGCNVGGFEVERLIGLHRGERRYLAVDATNDEAKVVLRVFPLFGPHEPEFRRVSKRAEVATRVEHPNLERCIGSGRTRDAFYAAYAPPIGSSLAERVEKEGAQTLEATLNIVEEVARGLKALHRRSQAHGALSPAAIRVDSSGSAVLCDAGLSRPHPAFAFLAEGELLGPPGFVAPEALDQGNVGPAADIYALGCVAWTLLNGAPPCADDEDPQRAIERAHAPLPAPRTARGVVLPQDLKTVLEKMTAADPRRRYANVNDLLADLRAVRQKEGVKPFPPPKGPQRAGRSLLQRNPRAVAFVFGTIALALAAVLVATLVQASRTPLDDPFAGYQFTLDGK